MDVELSSTISLRKDVPRKRRVTEAERECR